MRKVLGLFGMVLVGCGAASNDATANPLAATMDAERVWPARVEVSLTPISSTSASMHLRAFSRWLCSAANREAAAVNRPLPPDGGCDEVPAGQTTVRMQTTNATVELGATDRYGRLVVEVADIAHLPGALFFVGTAPVASDLDAAIGQLIPQLAQLAARAATSSSPAPVASRAPAPTAAASDEEELRTRRCSPVRSAQLQGAVQGLQPVLGSDNLDLVWHQIQVAPPQGMTLNLPETLSGEYQLFVMGYAPLTVEVTDRGGNEMALRSPYEGLLLANHWQAATRAYQANANDTHTVRIRGGGCVLVTLWYR